MRRRTNLRHNPPSDRDSLTQIPSSNSSFPRLHLLPTSDMSLQSRSPHFRALFHAALQDYEKATNITLAKHPIAEKLLNCYSVEPIITLLQDQARGFGDFPRSDRLMKSIKNTISVLSMLATTAALGDGIDIVCPRLSWGYSISDAMHIL